MRIIDLDYLEVSNNDRTGVSLIDLQVISNRNVALEGGYAIACAQTFADYSFGYADADAIAIGSSTHTAASTKVSVYSGPFSSITLASAKALAISITPSSYGRAEARSISLAISAG
jgi:hypothetical protein